MDAQKRGREERSGGSVENKELVSEKNWVYLRIWVYE
jgi:hypothetical protein